MRVFETKFQENELKSIIEVLKEGKLGWQRYDYKKLNGIWTTRSDGLAENIYFYNQWVGFKNIDYVCCHHEQAAASGGSWDCKT